MLLTSPHCLVPGHLPRAPPQQSYLALPSKPALIHPLKNKSLASYSSSCVANSCLPQSTGEILLAPHTPDMCINSESSFSAHQSSTFCRTGATLC